MEVLRSTKRSWALTVTIILAAEIFVADLVLPMGLAVWLPYAGLVLISLWAPSRRYTLYSAIAATALLLLAAFMAPPDSTGITPFHSLFNRALGVLFIWMTAGFCFQRKRVEETEKHTHDELERLVKERTAELSQSNEQLRHEVSQRKLALAELEQTRQQQLELKDQFLSHVSHELRSPLTAIYQFVTILLDGLAGDLGREQREHMEIVLRNANQLRAMIEDLLETTRVQTGKLSIKAQPTSMTDTIDETVSSLRALAGSKGIALSTDVSAHLPPVYADPQRIRQILRNLIENGIKFTPDNGTITIRAGLSDTEHDCIRIAVADTGCGISPEECEKIFERLYQGTSAIEASRKGLGLGLSICRELVSRHGGRIWVESQLGHGSTFFFTLPIFSSAKQLAPLAVAEHPHKGATA
ncbi:MAG TPA: HAMP domain-containing sensor histidine kinase [Patescibacteria group bacterium]|nr:HAMP domain-containing sensor histidine kinase [Patescibacteria group bacterium]